MAASALTKNDQLDRHDIQIGLIRPKQNKTKQGPLPNKKSDKINTMSGKSESERNY